MTVIQAVLQIVIEHVARGERYIKNHLIEAAHPEHQLSGRARIRELRLKGFLDYRVHDDNTYEVLTSLQDLHAAWRRLTGIEKAPAVMRERTITSSHLTAQAANRTDTGGSVSVKEKEYEPAEQVDIEEIRKFRMSLG